MSQLPTINNCLECRPRKHDAKSVSMFQRLGPMPPQDKKAKSPRRENFEEEEEDKYHRPRWCPDRLSRSQKRRIQRLRTLEEAEAQYLEMLRKVHPNLAIQVNCTQKKEWHPKPIKADGTTSAGTHMVFVLPPKF
jgi:hypothetical protein